MTRTPPALALTAGALALGLLAAGCTGGAGDPGEDAGPVASGASSSSAGPTAATGSPATGLVRADATDSAPPPRPAPVPEGLGRGDDEWYTGGDGGASWEVWLPVFTTGPAEAVNRRVRASADHGADAAVQAGALTVTGSGEVVTNDGRTVQVRIDLDDVTDDDVDPVASVTTVALTADDAAPVFLEDQLADPATAWEVLAGEATAAARQQGLVPERPLAAEAGEFADWQTSADGLELSFQHGQFGPGAPVVVVPWPVVVPLLTSDGRALLAP